MKHFFFFLLVIDVKGSSPLCLVVLVYKKANILYVILTLQLCSFSSFQ